MKGKTPTKTNNTEAYPGIQAILNKAFKIRPVASSDNEQRLRALQLLLNTSNPHPDYIQRMEREHAQLVSKWTADNHFLPINQQAPYPYSRPREVRHLPEYKAGKPMPDWLARMNDEQARFDALPQSIKDDAAKLVQQETLALRNNNKTTKWDRYDQEWKATNILGYSSGTNYRAYKLFSQDQHDLLQLFKTTPTPENKKTLLAHVAAHGELIAEVPKPDPPAPHKPAANQKQTTKVHIGKPTDV